MKRDDAISHHILPTSSAMVGVCLTLISIIKLLEISKSTALFIDGLMALDSVLFLLSSVLSYLAIRSERAALKWERAADIVFLFGLTIMVVAGFLLTWEFGVEEVDGQS